MNKIQICEIWKSLDSVFISKQTKFIYKNKENKTQTNNKCLNNWVIMSQLQLALAMILQVSGSLLQEWNTLPSKYIPSSAFQMMVSESTICTAWVQRPENLPPLS